MSENLQIQPQVFTNEQLNIKIQALEIEGQPWFIGKDVTKALGYKNTHDALAKHVDVEDKGVAKRDTLGGKQDVTIINESGLYSLILSSKLESAKAFKRWVTSEVLPTIRKHSAYIPGLGQIRDFDDFIKKIIEHNKLYAFDDGFKAGYTQAFIELEQECQRQKSKNAQT